MIRASPPAPAAALRPGSPPARGVRAAAHDRLPACCSRALKRPATGLAVLSSPGVLIFCSSAVSRDWMIWISSCSSLRICSSSARRSCSSAASWARRPTICGSCSPFSLHQRGQGLLELDHAALQLTQPFGIQGRRCLARDPRPIRARPVPGAGALRPRLVRGARMQARQCAPGGSARWSRSPVHPCHRVPPQLPAQTSERRRAGARFPGRASRARFALRPAAPAGAARDTYPRARSRPQRRPAGPRQ